MGKDFQVGESKGAHKKVWEGESLEVWVTSGGRYSILDPILGYVAVKSNIRELDDAIYELQRRENTLSHEESKNVVLHGTSGNRISEKGSSIPIERNIGESAYGGWTYLGSGKDYQVWQSPSGRKFQITQRNPERPYSAALSQSKLEEAIANLPSETPYQLPFPEFGEKEEISIKPLAEMNKGGKWVRD